MPKSTQFAHLLLTLGLTCMGLSNANSSRLNASESRSDVKEAEMPKNMKSVASRQPFSVSQLISTPVLVCLHSVTQPTGTPPNAKYRSSISCSLGTPVGFALGVYKANVNFPEDLRLIGPNRYTCNLTSSTCSTPEYTRTIDQTQNLWVYSGVSILGIDGIIYNFPLAGRTVKTYNDKGVPYPLIKPTRTDIDVIPLPAAPYVKIVERAPNWRAATIEMYNRKNWVIPPDPFEAHHIKPISWGGNNDPTTNGVLLGRDTHRLFTDWWDNGFSNRNW